MTPIISGTTTERIVRSTIVAVMFIGYSGWSFYDGIVAYPKHNLDQTMNIQFAAEEAAERPAISKLVTEEASSTVTAADTIEQLEARFGVQALRYTDPGTRAEQACFFGPGGNLRLDLARGQITRPTWTPGPKHTETDLRTQMLMGVVVGIVGLIMLINWFRVVLTRATLTDEGLQLRGKPLVPFSAMTAFRSEDYRRKGWVDLDYTLAGQSGSLRLDDYVIREFRPIVAAICERTGLPNPLPPAENAEESAPSTSH